MFRIARCPKRMFSFASIEKVGELPFGNRRPSERPKNGAFKGYDHLKYYCQNAF